MARASARLLLAVLIAALSWEAVFSEMMYPNWLLGKSPDYPEENYVIAVGEGEDMSSSKKAAYFELARLLETRLLQVENEWVTPKKKTILKEAPVKSEAQEKWDKETRLFIETLLDGARIADTWYNGKINKYYALSLVDKQKIVPDIDKTIAVLDEAIKINLETADSSFVFLEKAKHLNIVLRALNRKIEVVNRKRLLDPMAIGELSRGPVRSEIEKKKDELLSKATFMVFDTSDEKTGLKEEVEKYLTKTGYKLATRDTGSAASTVLIKLNLRKKTDEDKKTGLHFVHWMCRIEMVEGGVNKRALSFTAPEGQASDPSLEKARSMVNQTVQKTIPLAAGIFINNYINGYK